LDRQRRDDLRRALLAGFLADEAKDRERERLHAADVAGAVAARADGLRRLLERRPQPLPRELQQPEARDAADLDARTVLLHRLAEPILDLALVLVRSHVDEVDDDEPAEVANPELAGDLVRRLEIRRQRGFLDVLAL